MTLKMQYVTAVPLRVQRERGFGPHMVLTHYRVLLFCCCPRLSLEKLTHHLYVQGMCI